jgi:hypothetical protein
VVLGRAVFRDVGSSVRVVASHKLAGFSPHTADSGILHRFRQVPVVIPKDESRHGFVQQLLALAGAGDMATIEYDTRTVPADVTAKVGAGSCSSQHCRNSRRRLQVRQLILLHWPPMPLGEGGQIYHAIPPR